jgi:4-amino-4-deoxy-L-arabinose transferase-like glycosyltransferase
LVKVTADIEEMGSSTGHLTGRIDGWLVVIGLLALTLRLGWVLRLPSDGAIIDRLPDQREYLDLGLNLLHGHELVFVDPRFGDNVLAYRTPGYPAFVALCRGDVRVIRIVQTCIDASSVLGTYVLARRWLSRGRARVAAGIVAVNPFLIYFCGLVLSETLFTSLLVWGMAFLVRRGVAWWGGAILLLASVLVRPSALAMPLGLSLVCAFVNRDTKQPYDWRWLPPVGTLALLLTLAALLPWAWRNQRVLGRWIWTTTNGGITLYDGFNPDATGASDQSFVRRMPQLRSMDEVGRDQYLRELAWQFIREHPARVLQLSAIKIARTWSPVPLSNEYGSDSKLIAISLVYMVPLYLLIVWGIWLGRLPLAAKVFLLAPAVYFTIAHAMSVGSLRYRVPADVPMAVIAAAATRSASVKRS